MRVVFMGTPEFAVPSLRELAAHHEVALVVTRPDAVRGRGKRLEPSPVKAEAIRLSLPVLEAKRLRDDEIAQILGTKPDVLCVAAYGAILPDRLLEAVPHGGINVHGSLLPRWRGAAPIQRAILAGDERVGVSIMRMVHAMDAGAYCRQASIELGDKPCTQVMAELAELGARELIAALDDVAAGRVVWTEQDASLVTLSPKITKAEMKLDPADTARTNKLRVQASTDEAPARLLVAGKGIRAVEAVLVHGGQAQVAAAEAGFAPTQHGIASAQPDNTSAQPDGASVQKARAQGESIVVPSPGKVAVEQGRVFLGCSDGAVELLRVKPDGKREMDAKAWAAGLHTKGSAEADQLTWERA